MEAGPELCYQVHVHVRLCVCVCSFLCLWAGAEVVGCVTARCAVLCAQHLCPTA